VGLSRDNRFGWVWALSQLERIGAKALSIVCGMLSKASKRCHVDGVGRGERILHLHTRCTVDDEARGLQYSEKSLGKLRAERLQMVHDSGGVLEALIDVADLSIITDCELASEKTYLLPVRFKQLRH